MTHDYKRNGTSTLFASLDVFSGKVIAKCTKRHRHTEFLGFLKKVYKERWTRKKSTGCKIQSDLGVIKPFDTLVPFNTRRSEHPIFSSS